MKEERGVLLEIDGEEAVVMTPDGDFRRIAVPNRAKIGQEIALEGRDRPERSSSKRPRRSWRRSLAWTAAAAAAVLLLLFLPNTLFAPGGSPLPVQTAAAYVTVDINPSLEFALDEEARVEDVTALNERADALLAEADAAVFVDQTLSDALDLLFEEALRAGYLDGEDETGPTVLIASVPGGDRDVTPEIRAQVERVREKFSGEDPDRQIPGGAAIKIETVFLENGELREEARALDLSVGKYIVALEARSRGLHETISVEQLQQKGVGRVLKEAEVHPGEFLRLIPRGPEASEEIRELGSEILEERGLHRIDGAVKPIDEAPSGSILDAIFPERAADPSEAGEDDPEDRPADEPPGIERRGEGEPEPQGRGDRPHAETFLERARKRIEKLREVLSLGEGRRHRNGEETGENSRNRRSDEDGLRESEAEPNEESGSEGSLPEPADENRPSDQSDPADDDREGADRSDVPGKAAGNGEERPGQNGSAKDEGIDKSDGGNGSAGPGREINGSNRALERGVKAIRRVFESLGREGPDGEDRKRD